MEGQGEIRVYIVAFLFPKVDVFFMVGEVETPPNCSHSSFDTRNQNE